MTGTFYASFWFRSEDDYSEEEEDDDEEEDEYDGEIPQPELEPRSRRCLVGDAGVCIIPGGDGSEEEEEEDDTGAGHAMHEEDSDSDGPVLHKDEDSDEEDEPPLSKSHIFSFKKQKHLVKLRGVLVLLHSCHISPGLPQVPWPAG